MSHLSKIFEEAPIKVQNRNGFDLSHTRSGTSKTGQLVPCLTKLLPPNTTISLGVNMEVSLPPLAAPFYGKVDAIVEGFVVPCSILYGGWKQFISNQEVTQFPANQSYGAGDHNIYDDSMFDPVQTRDDAINTALGSGGYQLPVVDIVAATTSTVWKGLLATHDNVYEFFGMKGLDSSAGLADIEDVHLSLLPALAYHRIVDVFYRNQKLTRTWFAVNPGTGSITKNVSTIWHSYYTSTNNGNVFGFTGNQLSFPDGVSVFSTRQRTYTRDYFTSAVESPQQGEAAKLVFDVVDGISGQFTINSLRMANSLQKFLETNNISGAYDDMIRNRWGVRPIDADFDEPHYLGRVVVPVYQHTVFNATEGDGSASSNNPFLEAQVTGAKAASGTFNGEGSICQKFNISTWSYLMCLFSLVPHATYSTGLNRELFMTRLGDFPAPELQGVGMEEILNYEIFAAPDGSDFTNTFGYIGRFARFKYVDDTVVGELAPGKTLQAFQLQRNFTGVPTLGTDFVTIQQNALDGVFAVNTSTMNLSCWYEIFFNFKAVMPLADFCIPTLGENPDTHTQKTSISGSRL